MSDVKKIDIPQKSECVKVVVRCRPMGSKEKDKGFNRVVEMDVRRGIIEIKNPKTNATEPKKRFTFDSVYDWNSKQRDLYDETFSDLVDNVLQGFNNPFPRQDLFLTSLEEMAWENIEAKDSKQRDLYDETFSDLVDNVLQGFNGTIFAYGQTGTGKTFTMQGVKNDPEMRGVIPNSFEHIFNHISSSQNQQYLIRASYLEIYQEEIRDLLSKDQSKRLELKERPDTGVYVKDLSSFVTKSVKEIEHVMNVGNQNRAVGPTNMNEHSSRSHAIFIITIECSEIGEDEENHIRVGRLNLVDLAGSERQSKTQSEGERLKEATKINLSLSALGNVISALVDGKSTHIPYRDSKLTRLLQDSLGGNAKTVMVANIGPADYNFDETMSTLRYANRAKNIKNKPKINEDPKDALLREFQEEIARYENRDKNIKNKPKINEDSKDALLREFQEEIARYENRDKNIKNKPKINEDPKDALLREFQEEIARYANRAKNIKNKPKINEDPKDALLREFQEEIARYENRDKNIKSKPKINKDPKDALLREFQEEIARLKASLAGKGGPKKKKKGKKRRTRRNEDGEIISESEEDEEEGEGDNEDDAEAFMKAQQEKLESQKEAIMNNKDMIQSEKNKILTEIQERESRLNKEKENRDQLASKIKAMEGKLLMGGENIVHHTNEQQRALEQRRKEIAEQKRLEREMQQKLEEKEESAIELQETYVSLQQEVEVKTKKLKKLFAKLQATKQEIQDLQEEHVKERQELEQTQNELTRELKLKMLIIENFIPHEEKTKIHNRATYDEEEDSWMLRPLANKNSQTMAKRPKSALGNRRPVSEYARVASAMGGNPRFKGENILMVELDMPNRTTRDYDGPQVAPRIQAALDAALQDEDDIVLDGSPALFSSSKAKRKEAAKSRPKSSMKYKVDSSQVFPTSRGLVNK